MHLARLYLGAASAIARGFDTLLSSGGGLSRARHPWSTSPASILEGVMILVLLLLRWHVPLRRLHNAASVYGTAANLNGSLDRFRVVGLTGKACGAAPTNPCTIVVRCCCVLRWNW